MKKIMLILFFFGGLYTGRCVAQSTAFGDKEKMNVVSNWVGHWQGEGSIQMGPGEPRKSIVDENIQSKLDGIILLIEGIGKSFDATKKNETVVHNALAILSYDKPTEQYKFKTYLKDGRSADAWFQVTGENKYLWGFETAQGKTRYAITIDTLKKTWNEVGEYSRDGSTWMKFFEMNLKKVD
jgi:hypothetical protein